MRTNKDEFASLSSSSPPPSLPSPPPFLRPLLLSSIPLDNSCFFFILLMEFLSVEGILFEKERGEERGEGGGNSLTRKGN